MILIPILKSVYDDITLEINFVRNQYFDVDLNREEYLNWIPYELILTVSEDEIYKLNEKHLATLCLNGARNFIDGMIETSNAIQNRKINDHETRGFNYYSLEPGFGVEMENTIDDLFCFDIWLKMAVITNTASYDKGFRIPVLVNDVHSFALQLQTQLFSLL